MNNFTRSIIIGKGSGISSFLSRQLNIESFPSKSLKDLNLSNYDNIIYTSTDPSHKLSFEDFPSYLQKNIRNIYRILESNFKGRLTYLSSVDSGTFNVYRINQEKLSDKMFTPYSFSKYSAESLLYNYPFFEKCTILRLGLLWPSKGQSNFFHAVKSDPNNIKLDLNSSYYITPYSLLLNFLKYRNYQFKNNYIKGYLTSTNITSLSLICKLRGIDYCERNDSKYCYVTRARDSNIDQFTKGSWFDWENEFDFDLLIAKSLTFNSNDDMLPNMINS